MVTFSGTPKAISQYFTERTAVTSGVSNLLGFEADNDVVRMGINSVAQTLFSQGIGANYLTGLTMSNNSTDATNDIDIAVGSAIDSGNTEYLNLASAITKRLDAAWAVGTGNGGLDTGSIANATYFVYLIKRVDTGVVDVIFSTSASAPTLPTSYTKYRRIGAIIRSGATILPFIQDGDVFTFKDQIADISATDPGTAAVTRTLTVPVGIRVLAFGILSLSVTATGTNFSVLLSDLSATDATPSVTNNHTLVTATQSTAGTYRASASFRVFTNTSAQIRSRNNSTSATTTIAINTSGWVDTRGKG